VNPLVRLAELGQSVWYDYITRDLLASGELARLIEHDGLRGMTSNPTIFEKAIGGSQLYDEDIRQLADQGKTSAEVFEALAVADVQLACDAFLPLYRSTSGADGLVSLEVAPTLAYDEDATVHEAERLWNGLSRANAMIKIPGTRAGLGAITRCIGQGINVNVTLLFSVERYAKVIDAFLEGLEQRSRNGLPLETVASVASFFVSRLDTKVDPILDRSGAGNLRGTAAIANACTAYRLFQETLATPRWRQLAQSGALPQRPLWASTSTKDPRYPDTYYVETLVGPQTVDTIPPETLAAYRDHGKPTVRIQDGVAGAPAQLRELERAGIDLARATRELEEEGVEKFAASYRSVLATIEAKIGLLV
jgi:transaldolase